MNINDLKEKPIWQMTGEEFLYLQQSGAVVSNAPTTITDTTTTVKRHVYGIVGIAKLFGCSLPTANRIKKSGKIDKAITQIGRKIIVDAELALELAGRKTGGR
ncbi:DUF3853 family protein [Bacteroides sp.]|uniref:DUF3853 family protein n=1 Tax=Bacteroides sp. TaxID=29523 RepID=UPI002FCA0C64